MLKFSLSFSVIFLASVVQASSMRWKALTNRCDLANFFFAIFWKIEKQNIIMLPFDSNDLTNFLHIFSVIFYASSSLRWKAFTNRWCRRFHRHQKLRRRWGPRLKIEAAQCTVSLGSFSEAGFSQLAESVAWSKMKLRLCEKNRNNQI